MLYYGKVKLRLLLPYSLIVRVNKHKTFAVILINIAFALLTTNIIKLNRFVQLVLVRLNLPLNRLTVEQRFLGHNGNEKMSLKSWLIALLTSMDYCQFEPLQKLRCSPKIYCLLTSLTFLQSFDDRCSFQPLLKVFWKLIQVIPSHILFQVLLMPSLFQSLNVLLVQKFFM